MYRAETILTRRYAAWATAARHSPGTIELHARLLDRLCRDVDPLDCESQDLVAWTARHDWSAATSRSVVHTLRGFFGWLERFDHRRDNPALLLWVDEQRLLVAAGM